MAHQDRFDALFAPATAAILERAAIDPRCRVLDIGCGSGTLLRAAVDLGADAVGVDLSALMTAAAEVRVPEARLVTGDAQSLDVLDVVGGRRFDRVVSRFGVMFFEDPVAAFDRIRRATADASLVFCCWRSLEENPAFTLGTQVLLDRLAALDGEMADAPGPTSFADRDHLQAVLESAGWIEVTIEPLDFDCAHGWREVGVEKRMEIVFATSVGQRARSLWQDDLGPQAWSELLDEVRDHIRARKVNGEVRHSAATWIVTARS